jgi:hypothetical protein
MSDEKLKVFYEDPIAFQAQQLSGNNAPYDSNQTYSNASAFFYGERVQPNKTFAFFAAVAEAYIGTRTDELSSKFTTLERELNKLANEQTAVSERLQGAQNSFSNFLHKIGDPEAALENFKASINENLRLSQVKTLWRNTAVRSWRAYVLSWVFLILLLVIVPAAVLWQAEGVFSFFKLVGDAVLADIPKEASETAILIASVSRLVLVTLPVALYVWLIRIVVRFNVRSLLLMDDARQRDTMLQTYLHLVEQDAGVRAERPLILEAMFRRTPGHGPETMKP